ncbi:MAG: glycosyltransferase [Bacillus sp. (in: Bacteria)]|nr:glycosyltransferase [Bacillus sp. (in: firmicutes)]
MKKKMLFVIDSLDCAGAEKSLVTLLSLLDYTKYSVDLMLFGHGGILQPLVPKEVNIRKPLEYTNFSNMSLRKSIISSVRKAEFRFLSSRIKFSLKIRKKKCSNVQKARLFWGNVSNVIETNPEEYDIAISYAQGVPTFYVAEKVKAKKKYAWVNVSYRLNDEEKEFQQKYYDEFNKIIAVSDSTKDIFLETFPRYLDRIEVIYDINNPELIWSMAKIGNGFNDDFKGVRILTIGRLAHQKGYDVALAACKQLKETGLNFRWYALGKGPLKKEIEEYINVNGLSNHFILLGVKANPYPFIKNSDLYVQTSRFEGFGLAIAEARMLNIPVVTTEFDAVYNQMINRKNGLVVKMDSDSVCEGIISMIRDKDLREEIVQYLQAEKKGNIEEVEKIYQLIS